MSLRARRTAVVVAATALVAGAGVAAASAATGDATTPAKQQGSNGSRQGGPGHGPAGDRGGLPSDALASIAKTLGVTTDQLRSALDAARPADKPDKGPGGLASELADALNVDASKVQSILEANRPAPPDGAKGDRGPRGEGRGPGGPPPGGRPGFDNSALVSALAKGLNVDEATVKAALDKIAASHQADHAARESAFYAAVAKSLGVEASAVQKAFEAACPRPPARSDSGS